MKNKSIFGFLVSALVFLFVAGGTALAVSTVNFSSGIWNSSGNVGIGTTTPSTLLHVYGSASTPIKVERNTNQNVNIQYTNTIGTMYVGINPSANFGIGSSADLTSAPFIITSGGNIGIGAVAPDAKFDVSGPTVNSNGNFTHYQNLASYNGGVSDTGTKKITLPRGWTNTMMSITIKGYDYSAAGSWEVVIGGYNYAPSTTWSNISAEIRGTTPFTTVRLGYDGTHMVVLLGATTTVWQYPKIVVSDFYAGYSNVTGWGSGWTITNITDETGITNIGTPSIPLFINASDNIGIGTVAPGYKLDVSGTGNFTGVVNVGTPTAGTNAATKAYVDTAVSSGVTGGVSGTANYIPQFTSANAIGNSIIFATGTYIGIGTTAPTSLLDVRGVITAGNGTIQNVLSYTGTTGAVGTLSNHGLSLYANNAERVRVDTSGNVGIGTTTPGYPLDVNGRIRGNGEFIINNAVGQWALSALSVGYDTTLGHGWLQSANGSGAGSLSINAQGGNVGIGTTGPATKLHVLSGVNTNNISTPLISIGSDRTDYSASIDSVRGSASTYLGLAFSTTNNAAASEVMRIQPNGNVGIGTTTPSYKLDVQGTGNFSQPILVGTPTAAGMAATKAYVDTAVSGGVSGTTNYVSKFTSTNAIGNSSIFDNGTFLGVGLTSQLATGKLFIKDNSTFNSEWNGAGVVISNNATANPTLRLGTDVTNNLAYIQAMHINTDWSTPLVLQGAGGNVGIANTSPAYKLDVIGDIRASGKLKTSAFTGGDYYDIEGNAIGASTSIYSYSSICVSNASSGCTGSGGVVLGINNTSANTNIPTSGATFFNNGGNVGIGTTAPAQKLDVNGTVALYGKVAFEGADTWLRINQSGTFTSGTYFGSNVIRTDGQLQVGTNGGTFLVNNAGNVGIGTTAPADKLQVAGGYVSDLTGRLARNLLDTNTWTVSNGTIGSWTANGEVATENPRLWNNDPFGNPALIWRGATDAVSDASGGWNYYNIPVTDTKAYRSSVWFRPNAGAVGSLYLGLDTGNTNNLDGTANTNPYFHAVNYANFVPGRWYLFVGYIHASNDPSTTSYSAIYDGVTGQKVFNGTDYKNKAGITAQTQRTYSYYNTAAGTTVDMWGPRFEQMDGSEPSIGALLGGTGSTANPMYVNSSCTGAVTINWALGNVQHCTMTGNVTFTFTNGVSGGNYRLVLLQDATGGRTATWPASVRWGSMGVPGLTATPAKTDYVGFLYNGVSAAYDGIAFNSNF